MAVLYGRGLWVWKSDELDVALRIAPRANVTHILYKVADGADMRDDLEEPAQRIRDAGLVPFGWMWLLLSDPPGEAEAAIRCIRDLGYDGLIYDTEAGSCAHKYTRARQMCQALQESGIDLEKIYNCSFPNMMSHTELPYDQLVACCRGGLMPMAYGTFFSPSDTRSWEFMARRVIDEWTYGHYERKLASGDPAWDYKPGMYPALGPYRDENARVRMSPAQFDVWLDRLAVHRPSFFSVYRAGVINDNLLPLIRDFPLAEPTPQQETVWVVASEGAALRDGPDGVEIRALAWATELEASGTRASDSLGREWLEVKTAEGISGWVAASALSRAKPTQPSIEVSDAPSATVTPDGLPVVDGFDFPVGERGGDPFLTHYVASKLVDQGYYAAFGVWHTGEDWNGRGGGDTDLGHPVYAIAPGRVTKAAYFKPSWGNTLLIEHAMPDGSRVWSQYAHLDSVLVREGDIAQRGQRIAAIGKGERTSSAPKGRWPAHLHFEIRKQDLPANNWSPMVNSKQQVLENYHNPTAFIRSHRPDDFAKWAHPVECEEIIVDSQDTDPQAGVFRQASVEHWFSAPYGYQGTMLWTYASRAREQNWGEWHPNLPEEGEYEVWVFVPSHHATTEYAMYDIHHAGGVTSVRLNQSKCYNDWVLLGTFRLEPDESYVRLSDLTYDQRIRREVGFDAVKFVKVG
jgi:murein DD-endopeptidase MepM/ murein hydrolase activator NlpD